MRRVRRAVPGDAAALTSLMHESTAYHGNYARILDGYAVTAAQIEADVIYLAENDGVLSGFYSLTLTGEPELDLMFVADSAQGTGLGALLFDHMKAEANRRGIAAVKIVSHPPSVGFYEKMGAVIIGTKPPTPTANWERPILTLTV
ncbi:MAG: GNAT family N-acetyltransferase [Pseudomonadota bacterium]